MAKSYALFSRSLLAKRRYLYSCIFSKNAKIANVYKNLYMKSHSPKIAGLRPNAKSY